MHILVNAGGMLLIVLVGCLLILRLQSFKMSWTTRCMLHMVVLSLPLVISLPVLGGWVHVSNICCTHSSPHWDHLLDLLLVLLLSLMVLGALLYGGFRLIGMKWLMRRRTTVIDPQLQAKVDHWAQLQGLAPVTVHLCPETRPLALAYGIRRPAILLSQWMLEQLDERELEAVVTHELMHIVRHDYLVNWIATMLRDAFFYMPTSQQAYQQFRNEREIVCDDLVVAATRRPLALASALTKVWLHLGEQSPTTLASSLLEPTQPIANRVRRLISYSSDDRSRSSRSDLPGTHLAFGITVPIVLIGLVLMGGEILCWSASEWLWQGAYQLVQGFLL
jgi:hypothetical protein